MAIRRNQKSTRLVNILLICAILVSVYIWTTVYQNAESSADASTAEVAFLDVGQADSTLINLPGSVQILIDAGEDGKAVDQVSKHMPPFDKKIEYAVATHPDADHIGGFPSVMDSFEIGQFLDNGEVNDSQVVQKLLTKISDKKISRTTLSQGDTISIAQDADAEVLWPKKGQKSTNKNDNSVVLSFKYFNTKILFTGDAEVEAQNNILNSIGVEKLKSDVLKVAHHGAQTALNIKFLSYVKPEMSVISVGKNNSYGHPKAEVLSALKNIGTRIFRTDQEGTIELKYLNSKWVKK